MSDGRGGVWPRPGREGLSFALNSEVVEHVLLLESLGGPGCTGWEVHSTSSRHMVQKNRYSLKSQKSGRERMAPLWLPSDSVSW